MANATNIKALIRQAMEKQAAAVNTERADEHTQDVKSGVPASVDSQTAADAVGCMEKDPAVTIGTKAEGSTDAAVDGLPKETDDDQAFKSASDLRKLASKLITAISKAAETAITVDAAENAQTTPNTDDSDGKEEKFGDLSADGASTQTTTGAIQTAATKSESASASTAPEKDPADGVKTDFGKLASTIYELANQMLVEDVSGICKAANVLEEEVEGEVAPQDVDNLSDEEADELAAALEASAMDASQEGTEDADQVGDYLEAYQGAPEVLGEGEGAEGLPVEGAEGLPMEGAEGLPGAGGDPEVDSLIQMLEEAGISPEELMAEAQKSASTKPKGWTKLSRAQKRDVVLTAIKGLGKE